MKKTVTICFANNKGGSGKSTTCSNIGYSLAQKGKKVLLIDGDMQLNLSLSFFDEDTVLEIAQSNKNLYYAIKEQRSLSDYIIPTPYENLDIIPSSTLMSGIEYELFTKWQRELILKKCLEDVKLEGKYDYILIDAPPTLGGWAMNLLCASDFLLIPVEASPWGLFGLANMFEFYSTVTQISPDLEVLGIAVTKVNERKNYFKQTMAALKEMDFYVFDSYIRVDSTIEWAQDAGKPVAAFKKSSRASEEYELMAKEMHKQAQKRIK
ncbi:MAG: ParA family protein [Clostridia bacterium]|nr:ParA family protein [Clostridia bacterium]